MATRMAAILLLTITLVQGQLLPLPTLPTAALYEATMCLKVNQNPDTGSTTDEILRNHGYSVSTIQVTTQDGYYLTVFQITNSPKRTATTPIRSTPVFLNHGLLGNSLQWVSQNTSSNLATHLADQGYTVFLGNARGTSYSTTTRQDGVEPNDGLTDNPTWWNFSFHEMGYYDVPAVIEKITAITGSPQIFYVGHSMGGAEYYVMLSTRPEYNARIRAGFVMAPAVYVNGTTSLLKVPVAATGSADYAAVPKIPSLASTTGVAKADCLTIIQKLKAVDGFDSYRGDYYNLPKVAAAIPDTTSTKTLAHFGQMVVSGVFRQFDYNCLALQGTNIQHYNANTPPAYDLTEVIAPTFVYCGELDTLITTGDCHRAYLQTPGRVSPQRTPAFDHFDFAIAVDADDVVYGDILNEMINSAN